MDSKALAYEEQTVYEHAASRTGILHTPVGSFDLPGTMPSLRTNTDLEAVRLNIEAGMRLQILSPYSSQVAAVGPAVKDLFWPRQTRLVTIPRPLILADLETEALNFNCVARTRFHELDKGSSIAGRSGAIEMLMRAGFDTNAEWDSQEAHAAWRLMEREYGFGPLMDWTVRHLRAARSDVLSVPTPIIRKDADSVAHAMHAGAQMLPLARRVPHFTMQGLHLLIHAEVFDADPRAEEARTTLLREVSTSGATGILQGLFLSVKLYDPGNLLSDPDRGRIARTNLSEMLVGLQEGVRRADGVLAAFNVGNRTLGFLDSGVDLVGIRLTGRAVIDRLIRGRTGDRGARNIPPITLPRSMVDEDPARVRRVYSTTGAFPVPTCLQPRPYWEYPWGEAVKYAARARCGVFVELSAEYREAAKDTAKPLREAVASRVRDAGNRQELMDLCPSVNDEGN
jgi:hypothetical protein